MLDRKVTGAGTCKTKYRPEYIHGLHEKLQACCKLGAVLEQGLDAVWHTLLKMAFLGQAVISLQHMQKPLVALRSDMQQRDDIIQRMTQDSPRPPRRAQFSGSSG